jgi:hypothetical protein
MAMLTESREAILLEALLLEALHHRKSRQIPAIASLSPPQLDANPFLPPATICAICGLDLPFWRIGAMAPELQLWESAGYSNQIVRSHRLP